MNKLSKLFIIIIFILLVFYAYKITSQPVKPSPYASVSLDEKIGEMLLIGFKGQTASHPEIKQISSYLESGKIGGVIFYDYNIKSPEQTKSLISYFKNQRVNHSIFVAIDQEGGFVQRLPRSKGFKQYPSPYYLAQTTSPEEAYNKYLDMASLLDSLGFNLNFGTVVDININPKSPAIGQLRRSYSSDPNVVTAYAGKMIDAHRKHHVVSAIKHFPGHGSALQDSHKGFTNVTDTWTSKELLPYKYLLDQNKVDMVMTAHVFHTRLDPYSPASLSKHHINKTLREFLNYDGVIITDDLQMRAISKMFDLKTTIIRSIQSEIDILLFAHLILYNQNVVDQAHRIIRDAIRSGELDRTLIDNAYVRIQNLKQQRLRDDIPNL